MSNQKKEEFLLVVQWYSTPDAFVQVNVTKPLEYSVGPLDDTKTFDFYFDTIIRVHLALSST